MMFKVFQFPQKLSKADSERLLKRAQKEAGDASHVVFVPTGPERTLDGLQTILELVPNDLVALECSHPSAHEAREAKCGLLATWDGLPETGYAVPTSGLDDLLKFRIKVIRPEQLDKLTHHQVVNLWGMASGRQVIQPLYPLAQTDVDLSRTANAPKVSKDNGLLLWAIKPEFWKKYSCVERYYAIQASRKPTS